MHQVAGNDQFPITVGLIDDSDPPNATNFNTGHVGSLSRTVNLDRRMVLEAGRFPRGNVNIPLTQQSNPVYDNHNHRWLISADPKKVVGTYDGGVSFVQIGGSFATANPKALVVRSLDGAVVAIKPAGASTMANLNPATDTWSEFSGPAWDNTGFQDGIYMSSPNKMILWESRPSNPMRCYVSSAGSVTAYGANVGGSFPANFINTGATQYKMLAATSGALALFMSVKAGSTQYVTTSDGITFTTQTLPVLGGTEAVCGLGYDSANAIWYMMATTATTTRIWTSPSGATGTWGFITSIAMPSQSFTVLSADTTVLAGLFLHRGLLWRVALSSDGGLTWRLASCAPFGGTEFLYAGGGCQLAIFDNAISGLAFNIGSTINRPPVVP